MARRSLAGVFCIAKPPAVTSRFVVDELSRLVRSGRVGHAGTLDPLATGVLIVCVGWATRLVPRIHEQQKRYRATFEFGKTSDTDDSTGEISVTPAHRLPTREEIGERLPHYTGRILQVPPQYSAIKTAGERAYDLARRGESVDLTPRPVEVHSLRIISHSGALLELDVECGSGTYIRSIGRDLGRDLGCGALMTALVRTAVGDFTLDRAIPLDQLNRDNWRDALLPPLDVVGHLPRVTCGQPELDQLSQGRALLAGSDPPPAGEVALISGTGELVALGEHDVAAGRIQPRTVFPDAIRAVLQSG